MDLTNHSNVYGLIKNRPLYIDEECSRFYILGLIVRIQANTNDPQLVQNYPIHMTNAFYFYALTPSLNYLITTPQTSTTPILQYFSTFSNTYVPLLSLDSNLQYAEAKVFNYKNRVIVVGRSYQASQTSMFLGQ